MSGLCGWWGHGAHLAENQQLIERMAAPITRFDNSQAQMLVSQQGALAVASSGTDIQLFQDAGLSVAVWGHARFTDPELDRLAQREGIAKALAAGYRVKRADVFPLLSGTFAVAILNESDGEVVLAIDRMGIHPLCHMLAGNCLVFGSSADAVKLHPLMSPQISPQAMYNYVYFHMVPGPDTIYSGLSRLPAGSYLVYRNGKAVVKTYWEMNFLEHEKQSFGELKQTFLSVLRGSVQEAITGRKVGAFLSGGTDSSTLAGLLAELGTGTARTYSIGFASEGYDEMEYARLAARHFATEHHEYYVTPDDVVKAVPQIAAIYDQPFGNSSAVPAYYCASMARADGVQRLLGGDGGDELFGGNERYAKQYVFSLYDHLPSAVRRLVIEPLAFATPGGAHIAPVRKLRSYIEQASVPMPARMESYNLMGRFGHERIFTRAFLDTVEMAQPLSLLQGVYHNAHAQTLINRMLALDFKFTLTDNDLPKVTRSCELAGVEVAFPLLHDEVVAFSARLAPQMKLKGTKLRYFFKEALRGFLPEQIISKQKHGFGLPFGPWLQTHKPLQELVSDSLHDLKVRKVIRAEFIDELTAVHVAGHPGYYGTMVWVLMMLEQWFKQHHD